MNKNPTDSLVAQRIGELELNRIRMSWMIEASHDEIGRLTALVAAKDAEIDRLKLMAESPKLPLDGHDANPYANGATDAKPH